MLHFITILILLVPFVMAGKWLLHHPGEVHIAWMGYDITIHTLVISLVALLVVVLVIFFTITFWQIITWPERRRERRRFTTLTRGLNQLTVGVTALAMGDEARAKEALDKALVALPNDPLPQLLTAQLLQRQGKHADAQLHLRNLMQHTLTAPLATRRLIEQHVEAGEWLEATRLAEQARKQDPKDRWLVETLLGLYAHEKNSSAMLALTEGWRFQSPLSKEARHRQSAIAHYLHATTHEDVRAKSQALRHAIGYAPDFLPAVIDYAALLQSTGELRRARKMLLAAWQSAPRPILITPILDTLAEESDRAQGRLLKPFLKGDASASKHLLSARHAMQMQDFARAKESLEAALDLEETQLACSWMAEVEKQLRGSDAANVWLARAVEAPSGMAWVCMQCGNVADAWESHCGQCGAYDAAQYERPEARITSMEVMTRE